jgi:hypothetical protein
MTCFPCSITPRAPQLIRFTLAIKSENDETIALASASLNGVEWLSDLLLTPIGKGSASPR